MKLSIGKVAFPIEFDNGDKDVIYFNPSDPDLAKRLNKAQENIQKRIDDIEAESVGFKNDVKIPETIDGYDKLTEEEKENLNVNSEFIENTLNKTENIICEEIDYAFNGDISAVVFKHCSPLAIVNGEYFILQFLNAISPEIHKEIKKANKSIERKMNKHISKYK